LDRAERATNQPQNQPTGQPSPAMPTMDANRRQWISKPGRKWTRTDVNGRQSQEENDMKGLQ
jgi:hypothetical protein